MPTTITLRVYAVVVAIGGLAVLVDARIAASLAAISLIALGTLFAAAVPLGRRVRRERLEFGWWLGPSAEGSGALVAGGHLRVRCFIRNRASRTVALDGLYPQVTGPAAAATAAATRSVVVPARSRVDFELEVPAPAAGRLVLHGLVTKLRGPLNLFDVPLYFPSPIVVRVLPRARGGARSRAAQRGNAAEREGLARRPTRGRGSDLYELRDFRPGDSFRAIAWKPSGRRGRLLAKEVEAEVDTTRWLIVDGGASMRESMGGARKLDDVIELAASMARAAVERGDRLGLVTVDGRVRERVPPGSPATTMRRVYDALLDLLEIVDHDLTEPDEDDLATMVAAYLRLQDGVDFRSTEPHDAAESLLGVLARHVAPSLPDGALAHVRAETPRGAVLRAFCRHRGLVLPHRVVAPAGWKTAGLVEALGHVTAASAVPGTITLVSDLADVDLAALGAHLRRLAAHGHEIDVVVVEGRHDVPNHAPAIERLRASLAFARAQRVAGEARRALTTSKTRVARWRAATIASREDR